MTTATKTWDKKAIYHSELVKASQGGLGVMFTGTPRDSKYPGKPKFVGFKVYGDDSDYTLNIENAEVEAAIAATPTNTWVSVKADGSRDMAWIRVEDANGNPILSGTPKSEIAQPKPQAKAQSAPPPNQWPEATGPYPPQLDDDEDAKLSAMLSARYYIALTAAQDACNRFANDHGGLQPSDAVRNIATTLFIQASGR